MQWDAVRSRHCRGRLGRDGMGGVMHSKAEAACHVWGTGLGRSRLQGNDAETQQVNTVGMWSSLWGGGGGGGGGGKKLLK